MKRFNHHLTELQINKLKKLSLKFGLSVSEIIRRALDMYLINPKKGGKKKS